MKGATNHFDQNLFCQKNFGTGKRVFCSVLIVVTLLFVILPAGAGAGVGAFADDPVPEPPPNTEELEQAITDAEDAKAGVNLSATDDGKDIDQADYWAPKAAFQTLNDAIRAASDFLATAGYTQDNVDAQTTTLKDATKDFLDKRKPGAKPPLPPITDAKIDAVYMKVEDSKGNYHAVGETYSNKKYKTLSIEEKGAQIQLYSYYSTGSSDGVQYQTADSGSPLGPVEMVWTSSDNGIATVSPDGLIQSVADGAVTITAAVAEKEKDKYAGAAPSKSVALEITGQTGEYVKSVKIIDKDGKSLSSKDDADTLIKEKNTSYPFYALITWHDPAKGAGGTDRTVDTRSEALASAVITWSVGGSGVAGTINKDTGVFKAGEYSGNCYVQCSVTGGKGGKVEKDTARVQVDTGEYKYLPAKSLKLKVVYQEFPDKVVQEHTYSLKKLAHSLSSYINSYTILGSSARYGTIRARGYLFKDVLALEGVDIKDVYQYRFTTADGYDNPITSKLLYGSGSRYYFPNWDIGSRAGAKVVPPMLAYSSNLMWGESEISPSVPLDESTRFRLVFGPLWSGESNSSFQIYYIQAITIVMKGAPPADNGKGKGKGKDSGDGDKGGGKDKGAKAALTAGGGDGDGTGPGSGSGSGNGGNSGTAAGATAGSSPGGTSDVGTGDSADAAYDGTGDNSGLPGGDWKIYEMISNSRSSVAPLDADLPLLPLAGPIACGGIVAGGLSFLFGYRRRLA